MDVRSFQLDLEVMLLIHGRTFTDQLRHIEHDYRSVSRKLTAAHWTERSIARLVVDRLTGLTSAVQ